MPTYDPIPHTYKVGEWIVDPNIGQIHNTKVTKQLQHKTMNVLSFLVEHAQQVLSKDDFANTVWRGRLISDEPLTRCISILRKAFGDDKRSPQYIETISKKGYRLIAPVSQMPSPTSELRCTTAEKIAQIPVLSILPFKDISHSKTLGDLSMLLYRSLHMLLGKEKSFQLTSMMSSSLFSDLPPTEFQQQLKTDYILYGNVSFFDKRIKLFCSMIHLKSSFSEITPFNENIIFSENFLLHEMEYRSISSQISNTIHHHISSVNTTNPTHQLINF